MPRLHLYFHTPVPVFKARVNLASATYPLTQIPYDTVTLGDYTDIEFDSILTLGTTEGGDDLGRVRVNKTATSSLVNIARSAKGIEDGTLTADDNAYLTVWDDPRVWAKIPYFDLDSGVDFKDGDVPPGDFNTNIPPKANCGPGSADYISEGVITVQFPRDGVNTSFAMADGATIATHAWDVKDGTITEGTAADAVITATFPAGFRWVTYTVVDSNGVPHTSRCPVLAVDPADDVTFKHYQVSQRFSKTTQTLDVKVLGEMPREEFPDGTLVMFWWDAPSSPGDRSHMKFIGWTDSEEASIQRDKRGIRKQTTVHCIDVNGRLAKLPGFPQALEREVEEELGQWSYMPTLDINKSLFYLLFWHSTALNLADFVLPAYGSDYTTMRLDAGGASLFEQVSSQAQKIVPDHYLTCNAQGQIEVKRDWRLDDVGDRPTSAPIITESLWNDMQVTYDRHPKVHVLRSAAIIASTDFIEIDGEETLPVAQSIAPGDAAAFGQGLSEAIENEGLTLSQDALNKSEGHRYAILNSRFGPFTFSDPTGTEFWDYEPALMNRVQVNISEATAAQRGLPFTTASGMVKDMTVQYNTDKRGTVVKVSLTWEKEEEGYPALTHEPEETEPVDYTPPPPTTPPDDGLVSGQEMVAAIIPGWFAVGSTDTHLHVARTSDFQTDSGSGGPTWNVVDVGDVGEVFSWVVDPFSPGYVNGSGAVNGWVVTWDAVYRLEDLFGTPAKTLVHTFTHPIAHADGHWRTIQASFGRYFEDDNPWLGVVSYYKDSSGHEGTWFLRSLDAGTTWETEVQVSAHYDTLNTDALPIGLYLSPKTPGLAYTVAYLETEVNSPTMGFRSEDWGETWQVLNEEDPDQPLPHWGIILEGSETLHQIVKGPAAAVSLFVRVADTVTEDGQWRYLLAPPDNAKRVVVEVEWGAARSRVPVGSSFGGADIDHTASVGSSQQQILSHDFDFVLPAYESGASGGYQMEFQTFGTGDWNYSRDDLAAYAGGSQYALFARFQSRVWANSISEDVIAQAVFSASFLVTEIELWDGTIYQPARSPIEPLQGHAGAIHLPWPSNDTESIIYYGAMAKASMRRFQLRRATGSLVEDIGPVDGGITYGVNHGHFSVRTHDSNRSHVLLGGRGNHTSTSTADDMVGLWKSGDGGDTWSQLIAPVSASQFMFGLSAAYGADSENVIFAWGGLESGGNVIMYSDDGATMDSRIGNLASLLTEDFALLGIAGGPTA